MPVWVVLLSLLFERKILVCCSSKIGSRELKPVVCLLLLQSVLVFF